MADYKEQGLTNWSSNRPAGEHQFAYRREGEYRGSLIATGGSDPATGHSPYPQWGGPAFTPGEFFEQGEHCALPQSDFAGGNQNYGVR